MQNYTFSRIRQKFLKNDNFVGPGLGCDTLYKIGIVDKPFNKKWHRKR